MFNRSVILQLLNFIAKTVQVTEGRILASPDLEDGKCENCIVDCTCILLCFIAAFLRLYSVILCSHTQLQSRKPLPFVKVCVCVCVYS
jgi:hypothetical protein